MSELTYTLTSPFDYAHKGEQVAASWIELKPPTSKNMTQCAALKQAFYRALPDDGEVKDETADKENIEINGDDIMSLIIRSKDVELITVLLHARELFTSGLALVDGEEKLTKPLLDMMSNDDVENMTGEYLANFILASALRKLKGN